MKTHDTKVSLSPSDWTGEPRVPGCPRLHPLPGRPVRRPGARPHHPEVPGAAGRRGHVLLHLPRGVQPQPLQAALPQPHEQRGADGAAEGRGAGGGGAGVRVQHTGEEEEEEEAAAEEGFFFWRASHE